MLPRGASRLVWFVLTSPCSASFEGRVHGEKNINTNISSIALREAMFPRVEA